MEAPKVKICGLARGEDVAAVAALGPDALGFVFWGGSKRAVTPEQVGAWVRDVDPGMLRVGVFVDAARGEIERAVEVAGLSVVQLHGDEAAEDCVGYGVPVWKACSLGRADAVAGFPVAAMLLDSATAEAPGGTGRVVDWDRAAEIRERSLLPVILAGGLKAGNVGAALARVRPWAVDVSSGVERVPGEKDLGRVEAFIRAVRAGVG